jgi:Spy/CpxP family protein refolding chaperone
MKKLFIGLMLVAFFSTYSQADERRMGQGMRGMMGQGMMGEMMREMKGMWSNPWFRYGVTLTLQNAEKLGLTDKQKEQLEDIRRKYTKDIIRQDAELDIVELDIEKLLGEPAIDLAKVKDALKKIGDIKMQIRYLRVEAFVEARKVLTDEQREKLKKLMEKPVAPMMMREMMGGMMEGMGGMMGGEKGEGGPNTQEKAAGEVTVIATFKNPEDVGEKEDLEFDVKLDTHTVNLDAYNFEKNIILRDETGKTFKPASVKTSGSGHHRSAEIGFKNPGKVKSLELLVRDVGGVKETAFKWEVSPKMMGE